MPPEPAAMPRSPLPLLALGCALAASLAAAPLTLTVAPPAPARVEGFHLGSNRAPDGATLSLDSRSLLLDGRRWTPVMGEFHFTRYPAAEWETELRRLRAGGIDIVATYVFWIHHEEIEGAWNWSGDRDLRRFVEAAARAGLKVIVRCGPWCHGEVRNGGVPDWALARGWKVRTDDPAYLQHVRVLYGQIAAQLRGQLWKDGGPVIGIQLENEYGGDGSHLLALKRIAREAGLDVPLYTRTGWPALKSPLPFGEIVPLYGAYAEGFWDRETTAMPGRYWTAFRFSRLRTDANIANEALGRRDARDPDDVALYPYLTCELGGGMMSSYHRRIAVDPRDIETVALVKLGSGSVSPGYYMYHGGTNPVGRTPLMEQQDTPMTNWNDLPVKNYDFVAPLGQYGQVRPHYALLRRLHSFLHDFGDRLAECDVALPDVLPQGREDVATLRWSVRSDGARGFLFVNNHERGRTLPAHPDVRFTVAFPGGRALTLPSAPVAVPSGARFLWPLNLVLGPRATLAWATAQPLAVERVGGRTTWYFFQTDGIPVELAVRGATVTHARGRTATDADGNTLLRDLAPDRAPACTLDDTIDLVVLSEADSLAFQLAPAGGGASFAAPAPRTLTPVAFDLLQPAGPPRDIPLGRAPKPVAAAPVDADFAAAALWRIRLSPADLARPDALLRLHYRGDVLRVTIGGELVMDDFYHGEPLELGLARHRAALAAAGGELTVAVLPLRRDAVEGERPPIYLPREFRPDFTHRDAVAELLAVELDSSAPSPAR